VGVLGAFELQDAGSHVELRGARLRALLATLALTPSRIVSVQALSAALWGAEPPGDEANAVQSLVSRLRRALPDPSRIESQPGGYRLKVDPDDVDALLFTKLARQGQDALRRNENEVGAEILARALALWRGPALADLLDAGSFAEEAVRLERLRREALHARIGADIALGRAAEVIDELETLSTDDPLQEATAQLLMKALYDTGQQARSLQAFERVRVALVEQLGIDPSPELASLHVQLLRGERMPPQESPAATAHRTNLRAPLTGLVGRGGDLHRITGLLQEHRLVTLIGPGGVGKTRLCVAAAELELGDGDVWFVELASVTDADDIAQATLDDLDLNEAITIQAGRRRPVRQDARARLVDALSAAPALLVLDNCEHIIDGAAHLVDHLLGSCPQLRVLTTSREPLAITGEMICPVPILERPEPDASRTQALATSAVTLFLERAQAVQPDFTLDDTTLAPVVEICRRLDGLPLAIELAAARLRGMTAEALAARLDQRFRLLVGGSRTAVARHRTLQAVVEWSWDLLSEGERELAERFSVFPAGATADAVQAVCFDDAADADNVLDALTALADKSLLQVINAESAAEPTRYRMLETLREFGSDRLTEIGALRERRRAHARYYRDLAERTEPLLRTASQAPAMLLLESERDNILAALRFSADDGDAETAVRIGAALGWYWVLKDSHAEAATWLELALGVPGPRPPEAMVLATGLYAVNAVASGLVDVLDPRWMTTVLTDLPEMDPLTGHPLLTLLKPLTSLLSDDEDGFRVAFEANLAHPDPWAQGALYFMRAQLYENIGDIAAMQPDLAVALERFRSTGDGWGISVTLSELGGLLLMAQDNEGARQAFDEALELTGRLRPDRSESPELLLRLATVEHRTGNLDRAAQLVDRAAKLAEGSGSRSSLLFVGVTRSQFALAAGDLAEARAALDQISGLSDIPGPGWSQMHAIILASSARLDVAEGRLDAVQDTLVQALRDAWSARDLPVVGAVAVATATWAVARGDAAAAARLLGTAAVLRGSEDGGNPDVRSVRAMVSQALGEESADMAYEDGQSLNRSDALEYIHDYIGDDTFVADPEWLLAPRRASSS
jgi:predicted ATPase/DNA-binding SARP family transcriptional activator